MNNILNNLLLDTSQIGIKILISVIILIVGFKIIKWCNDFLQNSKFNKIDKSVRPFLLSTINIMLKILLILTILNYVGVPMSSIIALVGSFGLALGLALQGGLSNIAGGVMILLFKPFKVGDFIDNNSNMGYVKSINLFYTTLVTLDNKVISLPNGVLSNSNIINYSTLGKIRVNLEYSVSYDSDIDKVKKVINSIINKDELIIDKDASFISISKYDCSAIIIIVKVWTLPNNYFQVQYNINEQIKKAFNNNNIEIPYNKLDVIIKK